MKSHLQKITARAKVIRKSHPAMKWTDAIKKASKQVAGVSTASLKKTMKKQKVTLPHGYQVKKRKCMSGMGTISQHKKHIRDMVEDKLSKKLLQHHLAKTVREKKALSKEIAILKKDLKTFR